MKKRWEEPIILVQQFVANEYVAACGDSGTVYKFECNAGEPYTYTGILGFPMTDDYPYKVTTDSGKLLTKHYGPCGETHEAPENTGFMNGFMDNNYTSDDEHIPVIIWTNNDTDVHCTENLDMSKWETAKS